MTDWRKRFAALGKVDKIEPYPFCLCEETELRRRSAESGSAFYSQCLRCGQSKGNAWPRSKVYAAESLALWDESLSEAWYKRTAAVRVANAAPIDKRRSDWKEIYDAYIASSKWKRIRNKVIARDGGLCQGCLSSQIQVVHHQTYDRIGHELMFDLVGLCRACHEHFHEIGPTGRFSK